MWCHSRMAIVPDETSPWSNTMSLRRPKWFEGVGTFVGSGICRQHPEVDLEVSRPRCSGPSSRGSGAWGGFARRIGSSPGFCTSLWSCPCGSRPGPWLWGRSRCGGASRRVASSIGIWKKWFRKMITAKAVDVITVNVITSQKFLITKDFTKSSPSYCYHTVNVITNAWSQSDHI